MEIQLDICSNRILPNVCFHFLTSGSSFVYLPAAMAQAKDWKRLVLPALLIGILGYACATPIALALGPILLRLPLVTW